MRVGADNTFAHPCDRSEGAELRAFPSRLVRKSVSAFDEPIGFVRKRLLRGHITFLRQDRRPRLWTQRGAAGGLLPLRQNGIRTGSANYRLHAQEGAFARGVLHSLGRAAVATVDDR
jgi:hypothetical protein